MVFQASYLVPFFFEKVLLMFRCLLLSSRAVKPPLSKVTDSSTLEMVLPGARQRKIQLKHGYFSPKYNCKESLSSPSLCFMTFLFFLKISLPLLLANEYKVKEKSISGVQKGRRSQKRGWKESWMDVFHLEVSKIMQMNSAPHVIILVFCLWMEYRWVIQVATEDALNQVTRIPFMLMERKQEKVKLGNAK